MQRSLIKQATERTNKNQTPYWHWYVSWGKFWEWTVAFGRRKSTREQTWAGFTSKTTVKWLVRDCVNVQTSGSSLPATVTAPQTAVDSVIAQVKFVSRVDGLTVCLYHWGLYLPLLPFLLPCPPFPYLPIPLFFPRSCPYLCLPVFFSFPFALCLCFFSPRFLLVLASLSCFFSHLPSSPISLFPFPILPLIFLSISFPFFPTTVGGSTACFQHCSDSLMTSRTSVVTSICPVITLNIAEQFLETSMLFNGKRWSGFWGWSGDPTVILIRVSGTDLSPYATF